MPNGIWNSGIRIQGATFTHTFNSVGTFPYDCTRDLDQVGTGNSDECDPDPNTNSSERASDRHN